MKKLEFITGAGWGLLLAVLAAAFYFVCSFILPVTFTLYLTLSLTALAYIAFMLMYSRVANGKLIYFSAAMLLMTAALLLQISILFYAGLLTVIIWMTRVCYFHRSLTGLLTDAPLSAASVAVAVWAFAHSHSIFLTIWSYLLIQALISPSILPWLSGKKCNEPADFGHSTNQFLRAQRIAENALQKLH